MSWPYAIMNNTKRKGLSGIDHPNWGKRLSKETRLKISLARKNQKDPRLGKHHSEESKEKISMAAINRYIEKGESVMNRAKWYTVNGVKCQGTFEKRFLEESIKRKLIVNKPKSCLFLKGEDTIKRTKYLPDFVIPEFNCYVDIKGVIFPKNFKKLVEFSNNYNILIMGLPQIEEFEKTGIIHYLKINQLIPIFKQKPQGFGIDRRLLNEFGIVDTCLN
jgi:hypothetical protein